MNISTFLCVFIAHMCVSVCVYRHSILIYLIYKYIKYIYKYIVIANFKEFKVPLTNTLVFVFTLACVYTACHYLCMCVFVCANTGKDVVGRVLLCCVQLDAELRARFKYLCVVRLRDSNTKQVVFWTVDVADYACVCVCFFVMHSMTVRLCMCVSGF